MTRCHPELAEGCLCGKDFGGGFAAQLRDLFDGFEQAERLDRGHDDVDGIARSQRLGDDVVQTGQLEDGAHCTARDHASSGRSRFEHDARGSDRMRQGVRDGLLNHRHGNAILLSRFYRFTNRLGNFARFADREADLSLTIADDDERAEAKALSAFYNLRNAIHAHDRFFESTIVAIATASIIHPKTPVQLRAQHRQAL